MSELSNDTSRKVKQTRFNDGEIRQEPKVVVLSGTSGRRLQVMEEEKSISLSNVKINKKGQKYRTKREKKEKFDYWDNSEHEQYSEPTVMVYITDEQRWALEEEVKLLDLSLVPVLTGELLTGEALEKYMDQLEAQIQAKEEAAERADVSQDLRTAPVVIWDDDIGSIAMKVYASNNMSDDVEWGGGELVYIVFSIDYK